MTMYNTIFYSIHFMKSQRNNKNTLYAAQGGRGGEVQPLNPSPGSVSATSWSDHTDMTVSGIIFRIVKFTFLLG